MKRLLTRTFTVDTSPEQTWEALTAAADWPRWAHHIRRVELTPPGPVGPTTKAVIRLTNGTSAKVSVTEFLDGRRFRWAGTFLWLDLAYDHRIEHVEVHTKVTFAVDGGGLGVNTIGRLFAAIYARNLDRAIPRLQTQLRTRTDIDQHAS
jgi:Polyketide cyclase / dehydrase and lipid transport